MDKSFCDICNKKLTKKNAKFRYVGFTFVMPWTIDEGSLLLYKRGGFYSTRKEEMPKVCCDECVKDFIAFVRKKRGKP